MRDAASDIRVHFIAACRVHIGSTFDKSWNLVEKGSNAASVPFISLNHESGAMTHET